MIVVEADGHAFVGPDNGMFWLVLQKAKKTRIVHLKETRFFIRRCTPHFMEGMYLRRLRHTFLWASISIGWGSR